MPKYIVHIYREMRLVFDGIEADTSDAAAAIARGKPTDDADDIEDCEGENIAALVDVAGDEDYGLSRTIDFEGERQRKAAPKLLAVLDAILPYAWNERASLRECWERDDDQKVKQELDACDRALDQTAAAIAEAKAAGIVASSGDATKVRYVIRSADEDGYWSNAAGWGDIAAADIFTAAEQAMLRLPLGGQWIAFNPYSVLLLYPDYASDSSGTETYYAFVTASDPIAAVAQAQRDAAAAQEGIEIENPEDFAPLLVTQGHHISQPLFNR